MIFVKRVVMRFPIQPLRPAIMAAAFLSLPFSTARGEDNTVILCDRGTRNIPARLVVGTTGRNNALIVTGGAVVNSGAGEIGLGGAHNRVLVSGPDSCWSNQYAITVGISGGWNHVVVADGGRLVNTMRAVIGDNTRNPGNGVTIAGPGSIWQNAGGLTVGWGGLLSSLVVSNGAQVFNTHAVIGRDSSAVSNSVVVSGAGSLWRNDGVLTLGVYGGTNRLRVTDGGVVTATSLRLLSPGNVIEISGGYLFLTNRPLPAVFEPTLSGVPWREIAFSNAFRLEHSSTLGFELDSSHAGNTLPFILVAGPATLDGDLVVRLPPGFQPPPSAIFTLMRFSTLHGNFRNVSSGGRITTADQSGSFRVMITESLLQLIDFEPVQSSRSRPPETPVKEKITSTKPGPEVKPPSVVGTEGTAKIAPVTGPTIPTPPTLPTLRCVVRDGVLGLEFPWNPHRVHRLWISTDLKTWTEIIDPMYEFPTPGIGRWKVQPAPDSTKAAEIHVFRLSVD